MSRCSSGGVEANEGPAPSIRLTTGIASSVASLLCSRLFSAYSVPARSEASASDFSRAAMLFLSLRVAAISRGHFVTPIDGRNH